MADVIHKSGGSAEAAGEERTARLVISTADPDRVGDVVRPEGIDFSDYLKSPALLLNHDHKALVGYCRNLSCEPGVRVTAEAVFHDETEEARQAWRLVKMGFLRGVSIGFSPSEPPTPLTGPNGKTGWLYAKSHLHEVTLCPVPCNPHATVLRGILDANALDGEPLHPLVRKSLEASMPAADEEAPKGRKKKKAAPPAEEKALDGTSGSAGGYAGAEPPAAAPEKDDDADLASKIEQMVMAALKVGLDKLREPAAPALPPAAPGGDLLADDAGGMDDDLFADDDGDADDVDTVDDDPPFEGDEEEDAEDDEEALARYRKARRAPVTKAVKAEHGGCLKAVAEHLEEMAGCAPGTPMSRAMGAACKYHHGEVTKLLKALEEVSEGEGEAKPEAPEAPPQASEQEIADAVDKASAPFREAIYRLTGRRPA